RRVKRLLPRSRGRAPLAIAAFVAIPLFFSALMASTLALEKPHKIEWMRGGTVVATWHDPTRANVAAIWLWALVPPLLLVLVGAVATRIPYGFYVPCVAGIAIAMATVHKPATWERHHTARYPNGVDLIPKSNPASDKFDPGQWERTARETALSLQHWTIGLALAAIVVTVGLALRRRYFRRPVLDRTTVSSTGGVDGRRHVRRCHEDVPRRNHRRELARPHDRRRRVHGPRGTLR